MSMANFSTPVTCYNCNNCFDIIHQSQESTVILQYCPNCGKKVRNPVKIINWGQEIYVLSNDEKEWIKI